jgi:hypothetical protein
MLTKPPPYHQLSLYKAILTALIAAGQRLEAPHWPIDYEPGIRAGQDADCGSLPSDPRQWLERLTVPDPSCWPAGWRSPKRTHRELVELIERARDLVAAAELDPREVRLMLAEARAPMPAVDDLTRLAAECLILALDEVYSRKVDAPIDWNARKKGWREANRAADTLRQMLPEMIRELEYWGYVDRIPPIRRVLKLVDELDLTMPDLAPARRTWAKGAVSLAKVYIETVDPGAGLSRDGPAVQFLMRALSRAYRQEIGEIALEMELQRHRDQIFFRDGRM